MVLGVGRFYRLVLEYFATGRYIRGMSIYQGRVPLDRPYWSAGEALKLCGGLLPWCFKRLCIREVNNNMNNYNVGRETW
jgi:hypothetical protein